MEHAVARSLPPSSRPKAKRIAPEYHRALREILARRERESDAFLCSLPERTQYVDTHDVAWSTAVCSDGRCSDITFALGLIPGQLKSFRDPGSMEATLRDPVYMQRFVAHHRLVEQGLGLIQGKCLTQVHLSVAHSSGTPSLGCGAWRADTARYLAHMRELTDEINEWRNGHIIALTALLDTDDDSLRFYGSTGASLSSVDYTSATNDSTPERFQGLHGTIVDHLKEVYPFNRSPIRFIDAKRREAVYAELADRVIANATFVEAVRRSQRPPEELDHQERVIFIGRPLETRDRNDAFLIEDRGNVCGNGMSHLQIALKYVVPNCIANDPEQWVVPIFLAIPHNGYDANVVRLYAIGLRKRIAAAIGDMAAWVAENGHFPPNPNRAFMRARNCIASELAERVVICTTIHDRRDRRPMPVDPSDDIR